MNINLNLYKYFYEVAKYESYTKAAEVMMISQPSLSYSVKILEEQLGLKLFKRNNRNIELTNDGERIYKQLDLIFKKLDEITKSGDPISGVITIGTRSAYANMVLPKYIREINKIYPLLDIKIIISAHQYLLKLLNDNEIDIIIDEYEYDNPYTSVKIKCLPRMVFFTNKDNDGNSKIINNSCKDEIYAVSKNKVTEEFIKMNKDINIRLIESTFLLIDYVKKNNVIGLSPDFLIMDRIKSGEFVEIKTDLKMPEVSTYVTFVKKLKNSKIDAVVDFFAYQSPEEFQVK